MLPVAMTYVLPVLWMTSRFHTSVLYGASRGLYFKQREHEPKPPKSGKCCKGTD